MENAAPSFPPYGAVVTVIIVLGAWIAVHTLHSRRLRRFGDPRLLGLARLWPRRLASATMLTLAAGSMVALIEEASSNIRPRTESPGLIVFVVDPPPSSPGPTYTGSAWGDCILDLRLLVEFIQPERFSIYLSGAPPKLVIPPTRDISGAFLLLDEESPYDVPAGSHAVAASIAGLRSIFFRPGMNPPSALVVLSSRLEPELEPIAGTLRGEVPVVFIRSSTGKRQLEFRADSPAAQWTRLDAPGPLKALAAGTRREDRKQGFPGAQVLALSAFLLLFLECAARLSRAASKGRDFGVPGRGRADCRPPSEDRVQFLSGCTLLVLAALTPGTAEASVSAGRSPGTYRITMEPLTANVVVVTEISDEQPFVGQQFSVIYRLRCSVPPMAVDVDPQDFGGFWTVTAPVEEQARSEPVTLNGRSATDFLLRQVVVFPLRAGKQALPPLRLKIKNSGSVRGDWDLTTSSRPVEIHVRPLPAAENNPERFFMVGDLECKYSTERSRDGREAILEVEGTANLDFFRPRKRLKCREGRPLLIYLKGTESLVQTHDSEGRRRLGLLQRQRWVVSASSEEGVASTVEAFTVPFFDPRAGRWRSLDIPAFVLAPGTVAANATMPASPGELERAQARSRTPSTAVTAGFMVSCLALLWVVIGRRRVQAGTRRSPTAGQGKPDWFAEKDLSRLTPYHRFRGRLGAGLGRMLESLPAFAGLPFQKWRRAQGGGS